MTLAADAQHSWRVGTVMSTAYDADGWLGIQIDADGTEGGGLSSGADATPQIPGGGAPEYEMIAPFGVWTRPLDPVVDANGNPDAANSPFCFIFYEGGRGYGLPLTDPRTTANLPPIGRGDAYFHAANAVSGLMIRGAGKLQGDVTVFTTTDGTPDGQSVYTANLHDGFKRVAPWGAETFDANGWHIRNHDRTWSLDFGGIGGLPGPAEEFEGYGRITAPGLFLNASAVVLGAPGAAGSYPVLIANPATLAWLANVVALFQEIAVGLSSLTGATGPVTTPAIAAIQSQIATLAANQPALTMVSSTATA